MFHFEREGFRVSPQLSYQLDSRQHLIHQLPRANLTLDTLNIRVVLVPAGTRSKHIRDHYLNAIEYRCSLTAMAALEGESCA